MVSIRLKRVLYPPVRSPMEYMYKHALSWSAAQNKLEGGATSLEAVQL